jgi:hypothetical protein
LPPGRTSRERGVAEPSQTTVTRSAEEEHGANARVVESLDVRVTVLRGEEVVRPVGHGGDPGVESLERPPQHAGIDVIRAVTGSEAGDHSAEVAGERRPTGDAADRALPHVAVSVHQTWQNQASLGIDHARVGVAGREVGADRADPPVANYEVCVGEIPGGRIQRGEVSAGNEKVATGHGAGPIVDRRGLCWVERDARRRRSEGRR